MKELNQNALKVQLITRCGLVIVVEAASVYEALQLAREDGYYDVISATALPIVVK